jgi:peptidoglycan hydrolase-like protein with peptidoglycan-binding domain
MRMLQLITSNQRKPGDPFTGQIHMAIFWEETLFNNMSQDGGGAAIGFGQVETPELDKLATQEARDLGYFVQGVSSATRNVSDDISVQISSCILLHLFYHSTAATTALKKDFAYNIYSGSRQDIVQRWRDCENSLLALPFSEYAIVNYAGSMADLEQRYIAALKKSKAFDPAFAYKISLNGETISVKARDILFPRYWFFAPAERTRLTAFRDGANTLMQGVTNDEVTFLKRVLDAQTQLGIQPSLGNSGFFGSDTAARVRLYQQSTETLLVDGIVGPKTRASLAG